MSMAVSSGRTSHSVPYGRRYITSYRRALPVVSWRLADPFGHSRPRADRGVRVAFDLDDPFSGGIRPPRPPSGTRDVHVLAASDRAVRADGLDHLVRSPGSRLEAGGRPALGRGTAAEPVPVRQLPVHRPSADPGPGGHQAAPFFFGPFFGAAVSGGSAVRSRIAMRIG